MSLCTLSRTATNARLAFIRSPTLYHHSKAPLHGRLGTLPLSIIDLLFSYTPRSILSSLVFFPLLFFPHSSCVYIDNACGNVSMQNNSRAAYRSSSKFDSELQQGKNNDSMKPPGGMRLKNPIHGRHGRHHSSHKCQVKRT